MANQIFYYSGNVAGLIELDETTSRHIISVLRMKTGDPLWITDGKGSRYNATIVNVSKKTCTIKIESKDVFEELKHSTIIALSLLKNANRFEWFLEKATEIGVKGIIPLLCERTEKQSIRRARMHQIVISAMLQSQQLHLPLLREPQLFGDLLKESYPGKKFIAHCAQDEEKKELVTFSSEPSFILIGPEGDFTSKEILLAKEKGFLPVALSGTRLRTETAGIVAVVLLAQ